GPTRARIPTAGALRPTGKTKPAAARGRDTIRFGREHIDLAAVSQLVDAAQTTAIAHALDRLAELLEQPGPAEHPGTAGSRPTLDAAITALFVRLDAEGLESLSPHRGHPGHLARPRPLEVHAAVNRYRGLRLLEG
ncbi:MAG: ATPase, partial [Brachybacterium sp.]|nr:ATPase [Brachybacterium sp.]